MTKFIINVSTTGNGTSIISVSPNPSNNPTQVNRGIIKVYKVTQDSSGNTVKSLKKTINLLQKAKTTDTGGSEGDSTNVTVYRIEIWESSVQAQLLAQAPNGEKELSLTFIGITSQKVVCRCYSATMEKNNGIIDISTMVKTPMGIQCSDPGININLDGMAGSAPLKNGYFTISNTSNTSRNVDIKIYPEDMAKYLNQYAITIHLIINKSDTQ